MSRRHHDSAIRILFDAHRNEFYARDLGGRPMNTPYGVGLGLEAVEALVAFACKKYPREPVLITATVMSLALKNTLVEYNPPTAFAVTAQRWDARAAREWLVALRERIDPLFKVLGYITTDEYEAVRAIVDAGEIEALPDYLLSLASIKPA